MEEPFYGQNDYHFDVVKKLDKELPEERIFVEIGVGGGTSALRTIDALGANHSKRWFFTIDPYGDKPYSVGDSKGLVGYKYNEEEHRKSMKLIKDRAYEKEVNHTHWLMRSQDFMKFFADIEFWTDGRIMQPMFGLAFLDGEHSWDPVAQEFRYFFHKMDTGVIAIDDFDMIGGEEKVREELGSLTKPEGWFFNYTDNHHRAYYTKS